MKGFTKTKAKTVRNRVLKGLHCHEFGIRLEIVPSKLQTSLVHFSLARSS